MREPTQYRRAFTESNSRQCFRCRRYLSMNNKEAIDRKREENAEPDNVILTDAELETISGGTSSTARNANWRRTFSVSRPGALDQDSGFALKRRKPRLKYHWLELTIAETLNRFVSYEVSRFNRRGGTPEPVFGG